MKISYSYYSTFFSNYTLFNQLVSSISVQERPYFVLRNAGNRFRLGAAAAPGPRPLSVSAEMELSNSHPCRSEFVGISSLVMDLMTQCVVTSM